jgi:hypothetical protein
MMDIELQTKLKETLSYDEDTGIFTWLINAGKNRSMGKVAGHVDKSGYVFIRFNGFLWRAHRLAFLYMTGEVPIQVDHKDRVRSNNKWNNLRECDYSSNSANSKRPSTNTSGYKGVHWSNWNKRWQASIIVKGKPKFLGLYDDPAVAHEAYKKAAVENFGEYACFG